jgi:RNA polymerase sigma factor (TIGR02999 family)
VSEVTAILNRMSAGDQNAAEALLALIYDELRQMAAAYLSHERPGHTLQATALVHEAYLKMVGPAAIDGPAATDKGAGTPAWHGRAHFLAVAATAMRRVLVDHARRRNTTKRGGGTGEGGERRIRLTLDFEAFGEDGHDSQVLELEELLSRLAALDERKSRVVELRFYAGMTNQEIAEALQVARSTVVEDWTVARAWLAARLGEDGSGRDR